MKKIYSLPLRQIAYFLLISIFFQSCRGSTNLPLEGDEKELLQTDMQQIIPQPDVSSLTIQIAQTVEGEELAKYNKLRDSLNDIIGDSGHSGRTKIAKQLGISSSTLTNFIHGRTKRSPTVVTACKKNMPALYQSIWNQKKSDQQKRVTTSTVVELQDEISHMTASVSKHTTDNQVKDSIVQSQILAQLECEEEGYLMTFYEQADGGITATIQTSSLELKSEVYTDLPVMFETELADLSPALHLKQAIAERRIVIRKNKTGKPCKIIIHTPLLVAAKGDCEEAQGNNLLNILPLEMWQEIFTHLKFEEILAARAVSHDWNELITGFRQVGVVGVENKPSYSIDTRAWVKEKEIVFYGR
jgi:hypothetical protein